MNKIKCFSLVLIMVCITSLIMKNTFSSTDTYDVCQDYCQYKSLSDVIDVIGVRNYNDQDTITINLSGNEFVLDKDIDTVSKINFVGNKNTIISLSKDNIKIKSKSISMDNINIKVNNTKKVELESDSVLITHCDFTDFKISDDTFLDINSKNVSIEYSSFQDNYFNNTIRVYNSNLLKINKSVISNSLNTGLYVFNDNGIVDGSIDDSVLYTNVKLETTDDSIRSNYNDIRDDMYNNVDKFNSSILKIKSSKLKDLNSTGTPYNQPLVYCRYDNDWEDIEKSSLVENSGHIYVDNVVYKTITMGLNKTKNLNNILDNYDDINWNAINSDSIKIDNGKVYSMNLGNVLLKGSDKKNIYFININVLKNAFSTMIIYKSLLGVLIVSFITGLFVKFKSRKVVTKRVENISELKNISVEIDDNEKEDMVIDVLDDNDFNPVIIGEKVVDSSIECLSFEE